MQTFDVIIKDAQTIIAQADAILITAGAGMGVDSGLPDFRGNEGFWNAYPVIKELGLDFAEMANPRWFKTKPQLAWAFYGHRLHLYRDTQPHKGFDYLRALIEAKNENYFIVTSNVDGQFQKAGFDPSRIVEVHGSIHHTQCCSDITSADNIEVPIDMQNFVALTVPLCKRCGAVLRPNILMFGDWQWDETRTDHQERRYYQWLQENINAKIAIIEIGAGTAIPTIRSKGERLTQTLQNAQLIRINPRDVNLDGAKGVALVLGAQEGLAQILSPFL